MKKTVSFELSDDQLQDLIDMNEKVKAERLGDLVRLSLSLMKFLVEKKEAGCEIIVRDPKKGAELEIVFH